LRIEHPNGFTKIVLPRPDPWALEVRIHVWKPGATSEIHNHTSGFRSLLLRGNLSEEIYLEQSGDEYSIDAVTSDDSTGTFKFTRVGRCSLAQEACSNWEIGEYRTVGMAEPHRVIAGGRGGLSIATKLPAVRKQSFRYRRGESVRKVDTVRVEFYRGLTPIVLEEVLDLLPTR